ncbi:hypothetical protein FHY55_01585 [Oceanicola sp. D3]|uniref:hypothetical protein n=1 Tax=Oceanicola sp. D3 TaxID=2587163 RepID=UPI00112433F4|nr:hypothetical protein [Oceanicola sp. D3]QDC08015.1 hypothetical protein FHY55_01585 [Oceanicola sp. D3]
MKTLHILLDAPSLKRVRNGTFNFFNRVQGIFEAEGWKVVTLVDGPEEQARAAAFGGPTLTHMEAPTHDAALTCRRAYIGAFWRIEKSYERWGWPVAKTRFEPGDVDPEEAARFFGNWRAWQFQRGVDVADDGFVLIPLQGRLLERRSFQSMSPMEMIGEVLARTSCPVVATLHPREAYTTAEREALEALERAHGRFEVTEGATDMLLRRCSYIAAQNSSVAFQGYFLEKPAILFGEIDFHHIAGSVPRDGLQAAFDKLREAPDFAAYVTWFLTRDTLNAGNDTFDRDLPKKLRAHGWHL